MLAESYPADAASMLGLVVVGKGKPAVLEPLAPAIFAWAAKRHVALSADLQHDIASGFAARGKNCGDAFDAVIGLLAAIAVAEGVPDGAPRGDAIRTWEGWILGRRGAVGIPEASGRIGTAAETDRPVAPVHLTPAEGSHPEGVHALPHLRSCSARSQSGRGSALLLGAG